VTLSRRYHPEHPEGETCRFGLDFTPVLAPGTDVSRGTLAIFTNEAVPMPADDDWTVSDLAVEGGIVYAMLSGGRAGQDYQLVWTAFDTDGNVWPRVALVLCAPTS
jgi:hypothetical protein